MLPSLTENNHPNPTPGLGDPAPDAGCLHFSHAPASLETVPLNLHHLARSGPTAHSQSSGTGAVPPSLPHTISPSAGTHGLPGRSRLHCQPQSQLRAAGVRPHGLWNEGQKEKHPPQSREPFLLSHQRAATSNCPSSSPSWPNISDFYKGDWHYRQEVYFKELKSHKICPSHLTSKWPKESQTVVQNHKTVSKLTQSPPPYTHTQNPKPIKDLN